MGFRKANPDEVPLSDADREKALMDMKAKMEEGARAVGAAAKNLVIPMNTTGLDKEWGSVQDEVDDLDKAFKDEAAFGLKVLAVGPNGQLIDVSDKVNPTEIPLENIAKIEGKGVQIPTKPDGSLDGPAAMDLLTRIVTGGGFARQRVQSATDNSIRLMEQTLAKSDQILEHWRK